MSKLILSRHGTTTYNERGLWTGLTDVDLSPTGQKEAARAGVILEPYDIDLAYISELRRTRQTALGMLAVRNPERAFPLIVAPALNEKDYGVYTGRNKMEVRKQVGDEEFLKIRRSWDYRIPGGESLKDVYEHVVTFHHLTVLPQLNEGKTVLLIGSNNSLRAYVKHIENIPDEIAHIIELGTAEVRIYDHSSAEFELEETHKIGEVH